MQRLTIRRWKMSTNEPITEVKLTRQEVIDKKIEMDALEEKVLKMRQRIYVLRRELKDGFKRKRY